MGDVEQAFQRDVFAEVLVHVGKHGIYGVPAVFFVRIQRRDGVVLLCPHKMCNERKQACLYLQLAARRFLQFQLGYSADVGKKLFRDDGKAVYADSFKENPAGIIFAAEHGVAEYDGVVAVGFPFGDAPCVMLGARLKKHSFSRLQRIFVPLYADNCPSLRDDEDFVFNMMMRLVEVNGLGKNSHGKFRRTPLDALILAAHVPIIALMKDYCANFIA